MSFVSAFLAGLLFGGGLLLSGMTSPANVRAFLDVVGNWQPSLAFTMAAAVAVALPAYYFSHRRARSLLGIEFEWPDRLRIDRRLLLGSSLFGVGWGLSGICPGPALLLLTRPGVQAVAFFAGLVLGTFASHWPPHAQGEAITANTGPEL